MCIRAAGNSGREIAAAGKPFAPRGNFRWPLQWLPSQLLRIILVTNHPGRGRGHEKQCRADGCRGGDLRRAGIADLPGDLRLVAGAAARKNVGVSRTGIKSRRGEFPLLAARHQPRRFLKNTEQGLDAINTFTLRSSGLMHNAEPLQSLNRPLRGGEGDPELFGAALESGTR